MELLQEKGLDDVLVVIGGIIPDVDIPKLKAIGVKGIFLPGTPMQEIVDFINARTPIRRAGVASRLKSEVPTTDNRATDAAYPAARRRQRHHPARHRADVRRRGRRGRRGRATAMQAIARLEREPPDIVLADIGMPGRNGYEVAQYVKAVAAAGAHPGLLLTGAFEPVDQARARRRPAATACWPSRSSRSWSIGRVKRAARRGARRARRRRPRRV